MNMQNENSFEQFLSQKDEEAWSAALATLLRSIHEVDRNATQIWFAFYPLSLWQALEQAEDRESRYHQLRVTVRGGRYNVRARPGYGTQDLQPAVVRRSDARAFESKVERRNVGSGGACPRRLQPATALQATRGASPAANIW